MSKNDYFSGNLTDFISEILPEISDKLYSNQYVCQAMLRSMPPLCKQYVLHLLYIDTIVCDKEIVTWAFPNEVTKHKAAVDRLLKVKVFLEGLDRSIFSP
ncbi:hypothetical protein SUGI_0742290 [Cryptomeria japonica]|uniref:general transcription and DNA repair factor IIH subunit TFB2-like n=1 Tax=Cryptomeria japonica TaxID=3369 RepID=UPI00241482BE|nr:general transcription and DNA repair factor IIH subunit TFB2-like [Cryptomeria japonica]GLJ36800.1 hypothetical protein SUGI_0742290 [Cryptomeria japonica]